jgi:hypothetical protein
MIEMIRSAFFNPSLGEREIMGRLKVVGRHSGRHEQR